MFVGRLYRHLFYLFKHFLVNVIFFLHLVREDDEIRNTVNIRCVNKTNVLVMHHIHITHSLHFIYTVELIIAIMQTFGA